MAYTSYVDEIYYKNEYGGKIPDSELHKRLKTASRHIDSLTYNRIVSRGFFNLTEFQREIIKEVVCMQADFEYENEDMINSAISSYSLNGTSVQFGESWNLYLNMGIAIRKDVYAVLLQSGLCDRLAR